MVSAPPLGTATVRHVEVLSLQPHVVAVVVITRPWRDAPVFTFEERVDQGLVHWAAEYLREPHRRARLGARMLQARLRDPGPPARGNVPRDDRADVHRAGGGRRGLAVLEGTSRLVRGRDLSAATRSWNSSSSAARCSAPSRPRLAPGRSSCASAPRTPTRAALPRLVAGAYGLPRRPLGTVSLIGPVQMDYAAAMAVVRSAATQLSSYVSDVYDG